MKWIIEFEDDETKYVAFGTNPDKLPVYEVEDGELFRTQMTFPACDAHLDDVDYGELESGPNDAVNRKIERLYGELPLSKKEKLELSRGGA